MDTSSQLSACLCRGFLRLPHDVCQRDARGRQDAGVAVHEDGAHAQSARNGTGVLPARSAEAGKHVRRGIVALHAESPHNPLPADWPVSMEKMSYGWAPKLP